MLRKLFLSAPILFFSFNLISCNSNNINEINIIPKPTSISLNGGSFKLSSKTRIYHSLEIETKKLSIYLADMLKQTVDSDLQIIEGLNNQKENDEIILEIAENSLISSKEEYALSISNQQIKILGSDITGLFYGVQSLLQLTQLQELQDNGKVMNYKLLPAVEIRDKPAFGWRGLMLDCSRTFLSKEYILRYIDLLAFYKMNVLHLHLTDDQGWRLEIKEYPELTEICSDFSDNYPEETGGFYSQMEMREIIEYASERNITIVPEIEMPGHSSEVFAAFPELSCTEQQTEIYPFFSGPAITKDIYCAGNEKVFTFLENVLTEVVDLFPSTYIHIGGDEAPKDRWISCTKCRARINIEGLKNEHELQSYFIRRIEKYLNRKGRKLIGWDEITEGGLAPNAAVMFWRGGLEDIVKKAVESGNNVVMSPTTHCYFDYDVKTTSLKKTYSFNPIPAGIPKHKSKLILGGQANMWTHIARTDSAIDAQIFPRLIALSEALWSKKEDKNFDDFHKRLLPHYSLLETKKIKFGSE